MGRALRTGRQTWPGPPNRRSSVFSRALRSGASAPCYPYPGPPPVHGPEDRYAAAAVGHRPPLDVGCGTGEHELMAAGVGLDTTGVDLAGKALCRRHAIGD